MVDVKVVMEGSVCCACPGGVRVFEILASQGRWQAEDFIAIEGSVCALIVRAVQKKM